jgi:hypothetical protein
MQPRPPSTPRRTRMTLPPTPCTSPPPNTLLLPRRRRPPPSPAAAAAGPRTPPSSPSRAPPTSSLPCLTTGRRRRRPRPRPLSCCHRGRCPSPSRSGRSASGRWRRGVSGQRGRRRCRGGVRGTWRGGMGRVVGRRGWGVGWLDWLFERGEGRGKWRGGYGLGMVGWGGAGWVEMDVSACEDVLLGRFLSCVTGKLQNKPGRVLDNYLGGSLYLYYCMLCIRVLVYY